jgi:hypothetical protein
VGVGKPYLPESALMPEYQYDPNVGEAFAIDPRASKPKEFVEAEVTPEEIEDHRHQVMARGLSDRANRQNIAAAGDVGSSQLYESESLLLDLQSKLSRETDPIKQQVLQHQVEELAQGIVSNDPGLTNSNLDNPENDTFDEYLKNNHNVEELVQWAGENFDPKFTNTFNEKIAENEDEGVKIAGMEFIQNMRDNQGVFFHRQEVKPLTEAHYDSLVDVLGTEVATDVVTLAEAVRTEKCSTIEAIKLVGKSPRLKNGLRVAIEQGIIDGLAI